MTNRSTQQRIDDTRARLAGDPNVWVATASTDGSPHLVPLSLAWVDDVVVVATPTDSPTVRNAAASGKARASLDSADDVVIIDADVETIDMRQADESIVSPYIERVGWDPRSQAGEWSLLLLRPRRVQAWNGVSEITGRTIMRNHTWVTG